MLCALPLEEKCHGQDSTIELSYFTVSIVFLLMILNIPGNLLQILAVFLDPFKNLRTPFNFMMTNLAAADLIVGTVTEPMSIYIHWTEGMGNHVTLSQSRVLFMSYFISCTASLLSLAGLAVERYIAIRYPYIYRNELTKRRVLFIAVGIWTLSIGLSCIYFEVGYVTYAFIFANTAIVLTIAIICFMYCLMYRALKTRARSQTTAAVTVNCSETEKAQRHHENNIVQNGNSAPKREHRNDGTEHHKATQENHHHTAASKAAPETAHSQHLVGDEETATTESLKSCHHHTATAIIQENSTAQGNAASENRSQISKKLERRITKRFLVVLIALLLCYGPSAILIYAMKFCPSCGCITLHWLRDLQFIFVITNSSVNFFAYALRSSRFRKAFVKILKLKKREHSLECAARTADSSTDVMNI